MNIDAECHGIDVELFDVSLLQPFDSPIYPVQDRITSATPKISNLKEHIIETYLHSSRDINIIPDRLYQEYESVIDFITSIIDINCDASLISYVYFTILNDYDNKKIPDNFDNLNEYVLSLINFSKKC